MASVGGGCTVLANVFFAHLWLGQVCYFMRLEHDRLVNSFSPVLLVAT